MVWATALTLAILIAPAYAQTFTVIHNFTGGNDGATPMAGLTEDASGNFYGTASNGGAFSPLNCPGGCGIVFQLKAGGSGWLLTPLYRFTGGANDGGNPSGRVTIAGDGTLYGPTGAGGGNGCGFGRGCGTIFHLTPPPTAPITALSLWRESLLHRFTGGSDGSGPQGDLIFDRSGNIYGTTLSGGPNGHGAVYEFTPSGAGWTETVLYSASGGESGYSSPTGGVVFDRSGNLYGVLHDGGSFPTDYGAVYQLSPSGSDWTITILAGFGPDGNPIGGLTMDAAGNLYGTTAIAHDEDNDGGTAFELTPRGGGWNFAWLYYFPGNGGLAFDGPHDKLVMDVAGNLYGTEYANGSNGYNQYGSVFKLAPSNGSWTYTSLHDFTGGADGGNPVSNLVFDAAGNLYGTASLGGDLSRCYGFGCGVIFKIAP